MDNGAFVTHKRADGSYQLLKDHLQNVAKLSESFAQSIGSPLEGYRTGLLHDIGKYSPDGQKRQRDPEHTRPVDHSSAGVQAAFAFKDVPAAFAIAGHHGGLPDMGMTDETIGGRKNKMLTGGSDPSSWKAEIHPTMKTDEPSWADCKLSLDAAMYTRMLFSCLVDADFLDTEEALQGVQPRGGYEDMPALLRKLQEHVAPWLENPRDELCNQRNTVLNRCLRGGDQPPGLYTLTVPTGGGKTVSSLAFALSHAAAHQMQRVIYVIPYTSIIEQTADVFSAILGSENIVEHHSQADLDVQGEDADCMANRRRQLACENWDAPVIVTTAVQFFESLYAAKPSRCRKLHNIAHSVIIFDEAQTLPCQLLYPCVSAIAELVRHYEATAVLCTATQPALDRMFAKFAPGIPICEIAPDPDCLFDFFQRVRFVKEGPMTDRQVAERLLLEEQVLCVVNSRKRAHDIYQLLPEDGRYHLSTLMTASDREETLKTIRQRLFVNQPCRVISTSLIEAGVDVDFPCVWREMAGLDSILQAAGRCNREGKRPLAQSLVHVFKGEGKISNALLQRIAPTEQVLEEHEDINTRPAIQDYFRKLFWASGEASFDLPCILKDESSLHFRQVAEKFHIIDDAAMKTVYIPTSDNQEEIQLLRLGQYSRKLMRRLGRSAVSLPIYEYRMLIDSGSVEDHDTDGFGILLNPSAYDPHCGLNVNSEGGSALFA